MATNVVVVVVVLLLLVLVSRKVLSLQFDRRQTSHTHIGDNIVHNRTVTDFRVNS